MRLFTLTALSLVTAVGSALAAPSSFQPSCSGIDLDVQRDNVWIVADCGDGTGRSKPAEIPILDIPNILGFCLRGTASRLLPSSEVAAISI